MAISEKEAWLLSLRGVVKNEVGVVKSLQLMHTYFSSMAVPFKTAEEIEIELATLGTLFQGRYTRDDKWFAGTCSRGEAQPPR